LSGSNFRFTVWFEGRGSIKGTNEMANLSINGKAFDIDIEPDTPLLWAIRENAGLTGTKYGCGIAQCGACTVHVGGVAMRSCGITVGEASGQQITTIEGLAANGTLHKVQQAWIANDVPQCGYCQTGMIMAVARCSRTSAEPSDQDIDGGHHQYCRCGTFTAGARGNSRRRERLRGRHESACQLNRRAFVIGTAAAGAGLALALDVPFGGPTVARAADGSPEVNAWVVIRPDNSVVIRIARSEMGQGTLTGLAQLVAEELDCDWSKVVTEFPTPGQSVARKRPWGDFSTGGSHGIRGSQEYVRKGGATARVMLIQAAANEWKVPASECTAANGVIRHTPSRRTTTYGKVAEAAAKLAPPADVKLKDPKDWKIAGKPLKRLDTLDKTTGATIYGIDVKLPAC